MELSASVELLQQAWMSTQVWWQGLSPAWVFLMALPAWVAGLGMLQAWRLRPAATACR